MFAVLTGVLVGALYAILVLWFRANQSVIGIGLNFLATGLTVVMVKSIWNKEGISGAVAQLDTFNIPILGDIPVIGALFVNQSPMILLTLICALVAAYVLGKKPKWVYGCTP